MLDKKIEELEAKFADMEDLDDDMDDLDEDDEEAAATPSMPPSQASTTSDMDMPYTPPQVPYIFQRYQPLPTLSKMCMYTCCKCVYLIAISKLTPIFWDRWCLSIYCKHE